MNKLKMIGLAVVVSAGMAMAQAPSQAPNSSGSQPNQNQNNNAGANPAAPAAGAQTPNAGQKMPATASPLELIGLLGLGTLGVGAALRKPRLNA
ncbi:MAG TPA: hypothetical protein VNE83_06060 [Terriglobales bacterium]|nr:hypothetical protein [Terriglobales bacterium]